MRRSEIHDALQQSLQRLIIEEWDLAVVGAGERTLTAHLSRLLIESGLPEPLRVDNEYNRHMLDSKRAWLEERIPREAGIEPDIVVHRRGLDEDNILALEAKKARRCSPHDEVKIKALVQEPFLYRFGVLLGFGVTTDRQDSYWRPAWQWFLDSEQWPDYVDVFDGGQRSELNLEGRRRWQQRL